MKFSYWDSFFLYRDKSRHADRDIRTLFTDLARAAMFEQQNLNGGYFQQKYSYKRMHSYNSYIAYYNNVMYKAKKLATYLCYIYVASY